MRTTNKADAKFNVSEKLKERALELLDETQAMQFAEGLRLNRSASVVFAREAKRLSSKYGPDDPRTIEMTVRYEASEAAKADLFARFVDVMTPPATAKQGWVVDGFVRTADGRPVGELTVAPSDKQGVPIKGLGSATTDANGFFLIKLEKLPDDAPREVFMRAFKGRTALESNEVRLVPADGATERVQIILGMRFGGDKPPEPTKPGTGTATPPIVVAPATTPADKPPTGTTATPDKSVVTTPADKPVSPKPTDTGVTVPVKPSTITSPAVPAIIKAASAVAPKTRKSTRKVTAKFPAAKAKPAKAKTTKGRTTKPKARSTGSTKKSRSTARSKKASTTKSKR